MAETKWTQGPWQIEQTRAHARIVSDGRWITEVRTHSSLAGGKWIACGNGEADARLIVSAPDLYAALAECLAAFEPLLADVELHPQDNPARVAPAHADAALARARGE